MPREEQAAIREKYEDLMDEVQSFCMGNGCGSKNRESFVRRATVPPVSLGSGVPQISVSLFQLIQGAGGRINRTVLSTFSNSTIQWQENTKNDLCSAPLGQH